MTRGANRFISTLGPAVVIGLIGLLGWIAGMPWLVPSLGPTAALQATKPGDASSRPYNVAVGHLIGLVAGLVAIHATGAASAPGVLSSGVLQGSRVAAAALAVALSMAVQRLARASHPPAEATTLLVALGAIQPDGRNLMAVLIGILLATVFGEALRRICRQPHGGPRGDIDR